MKHKSQGWVSTMLGCKFGTLVIVLIKTLDHKISDPKLHTKFNSDLMRCMTCTTSAKLCNVSWIGSHHPEDACKLARGNGMKLQSFVQQWIFQTRCRQAHNLLYIEGNHTEEIEVFLSRTSAKMYNASTTCIRTNSWFIIHKQDSKYTEQILTLFKALNEAKPFKSLIRTYVCLSVWSLSYPAGLFTDLSDLATGLISTIAILLSMSI